MPDDALLQPESSRKTRVGALSSIAFPRMGWAGSSWPVGYIRGRSP